MLKMVVDITLPLRIVNGVSKKIHSKLKKKKKTNKSQMLKNTNLIKD